MSTWICLLRGVNLGAHNKLSMPHLRQALTDVGLARVRTYLQSGNVIMDSEVASKTEAAEIVSRVLVDSFALQVPVIVRTPDELRRLDTWCPFRAEALERPTAVHLLHLTEAADPDRVTALTEQRWEPDAIAVDGADAAIRYATTMHKSRLQHSTVLRRLGVDGTARNWRTFQALLELTPDD